MGLIICPKHGNGFMFVCPHVCEAIIAEKTCDGIQYVVYADADPELSGIEMACWFCPWCFQNHRLPPNGTLIAEGDEFWNRTSPLYRPMCPGCFSDWRRVGVGERSTE